MKMAAAPECGCAVVNKAVERLRRDAKYGIVNRADACVPCQRRH